MDTEVRTEDFEPMTYGIPLFPPFPPVFIGVHPWLPPSFPVHLLFSCNFPVFLLK